MSAVAEARELVGREWPRVALGEVCAITMGQAPSGASYNDRGDGYPLIAGAGDFDLANLSPSKFTTAPTKVSERGDLVLCIRATIGEKAWSKFPVCLYSNREISV